MTWDFVLHQEDFSYNDSIKGTIGNILFEIVYCIYPRGVCEMRNLYGHVPNSGYVEHLSQFMKEVHEQVKQSLIDNTKKIKDKSNLNKREV